MSLISDQVTHVAQAQYVIAPSLYASAIQGNVNIASATYTYSAANGAIAVHALTLDKVIPAGATVISLQFDISVALAGAGASLSAGVVAATDIVPATAIAGVGSLWNVGANPTQSSETTFVKLAANKSQVLLGITGAVLTAGVMQVNVLYFL